MFKATSLVILFAGLSGVLAVSLQKRDSDHAHERDHAHEHEVANDYHVPNSGYETPHASYDPPATSYSASSYDTHQTSYGETSYEPSYEAPYNPLPDITPIIVGILALLGLSLLFPNNVRINDVRKKRSAAEGKRLLSQRKIRNKRVSICSLTISLPITKKKRYIISSQDSMSKELKLLI